MAENSKYWLGVDTAAEHLGLALWAEGKPVFRRQEIVWRGLSERLHPLLAEILAEADVKLPDLAGIAVNTGPGSFTSLRIGLAACRGLQMATGLPVVGITHFEALAAQHQHRPLAVLIDAPSGDVYSQTFPHGTPQVGLMTDIASHVPAGALAVGNGALACRDFLPPEVTFLKSDAPLAPYPDPVILCQLAAEKPQPESFPQPLYLRPLTYQKQGEGHHPKAPTHG